MILKSYITQNAHSNVKSYFHDHYSDDCQGHTTYPSKYRHQREPVDEAPVRVADCKSEGLFEADVKFFFNRLRF